MSSLSPSEMLDVISGNFTDRVAKDKTASELMIKMKGSRATQADARRYAERLGELLGRSFREVVNFFELPGGVITKEIADGTVIPMLRQTHTSVLEYANVSQKAAFEAAGLGVQPVAEAFEGSRAQELARGLASKVTDLTSDEAKPWFGEPLVTYHEKVVDDWVRQNAKAVRDAGFGAKIIRTLESEKTTTKEYGPYPGHKSKTRITYTSPCQWCRDLAGTYDYDDVKNGGNDVYRRHDGCRCTVIFTYGTRVEDAHTKEQASSDLIERLSHGLSGGE